MSEAGVFSLRKTILVVEDDVYIREGIQELLESEGYVVVAAENGEVALEKLKRQDVDLILLDIAMPVKDGFQFRAEQEQNPQIADIPVVVMTADAHTEDKKTKIGALSCIRKPFDLEQVLNTLKSAWATFYGGPKS